MKQNNIFELKDRAGISDSLTELLKSGAQQLIHHAVQLELEELLSANAQGLTDQGKAAVVRNGYQPEREILTGIGSVAVKIPKVRSKDGEPVSFHSALVPPYVRKSRSLESALPWLYLKDISTGEMSGALKVLVRPDAAGLSASTVARLKQVWAEEYKQWQSRRLDKDGTRESTQSWREVLLDLKARGLKSPKLAVGDGAMGFWSALDEVFPGIDHQRCWVHKSANVLNKMPKSLQPKVKQSLHNIWQAETKKEAEKAFDLFTKTYEDKYPKAVECLQKIVTIFWSFTITPPNTDRVYELVIRLNRPLEPSVIEPKDQKAV
jgi:putative transposase